MIRNYFKIAFRSLLHNKSYSFINVTGLALGLVACIVIFLIVQNELGYDSYHEKADRTYRVTVHGLDYNPSVSFAIAPVFKNDFPEATVSQYYYQQSGLVKAGEQRYNKEAYAFADNHFSQIFDFKWLLGNPAFALKEPNTVVLTKSAARKFFGDGDALGKMIKLDNEYDLRVTGVIADLPSNTHLTFNFLVSWETIRKQAFSSNFWSIQGGYLYVALPDNNASEKRVSSNFPSFIRKNWGDNIAKNTELILQPLREIHFDKRYLNQISMPRSKETIYGLAGVALFIILTACINFVNLATAQALKRAKEIGVRKTLGAFRKQLIIQMMGETTLLVTISVLVAITAVMSFVPFTQSLLNIRLEISALFEPQVLAVILGITILTIFISGLYPALVQSRFQPLKALKSGVSGGPAGNSGLRKGLVVVQFAITQIMIVGTLVVGNQMDFFLNQDLGYDKEAIITFPTGAKSEVLYQQLLEHPGIKQVSFASGGPAYNNNFAPFLGIGSDMKEADVTEIKQVDEHYMPMYKMQLLAGKPIEKRNGKDSIVDVVVNETLMRKIGVKDPEKAIGRLVQLGETRTNIMGVVKDFQSESKHKKIRACVIVYNPEAFWQASVKLRSADMRETLAAIEQDWLALNPESMFSYEFLDEHIASMYSQEKKMYNAFRLFSGIAILIGCLGLYGLVMLMAVQKTKEIGVRKVLGASVSSIVILFFNQFIWLIVGAFFIAAPLAWFFMDKWLQEFAYHVNISTSIFLVSIIATVIIAGLTISFQSVKAALMDPVKSLKSE